MKNSWLAIDWGTSNLRIWHVGSDGRILHEARSNEGMSSLAKDEFEPCLLKHVSPWLDGPILALACGMVGARQGWHEAAYVATPCAVTSKLTHVPTHDPRLDLRIVSGIMQADPADVMRGEETQIAGFLGQHPEFEGVIALPGTHSKWVRVAKGQIENFRTIMTGESYALYSQHSVLRFSMGTWDEAAFEGAALDAFARPDEAAAMFFNIRARDLLAGDKAGQARLSGLLIGLELRATRALWQSAPVAIIGASELAGHYHQLLRHLGADAEAHDGQNMTLQGLTTIKESLT